MPRVLEPSEDAVRCASSTLHQGGVVAFPTETVYGLGADTMNAAAIARVYAMKGRPSDNPLIAHVAGVKQARHITAEWGERCEALADEFWPGALTIVQWRSPKVPAEASGGRDTIAVRCPDHPIAHRLLTLFEGAISAPSANKSGCVSATTAAHVMEEFSDEDDLLVLDGGACDIGLESTVVDLTTERPRILRPGAVTNEQVRTVLGDIEEAPVREQDASPGTRLSHYAPQTPVRLVSRAELEQAIESGDDVAALFMATTPSWHGERLIQLPSNAQGYARRLYAALREADAMAAQRIVIETPPDGPEWAAVRDRLARAAAPR